MSTPGTKASTNHTLFALRGAHKNDDKYNSQQGAHADSSKLLAERIGNALIIIIDEVSLIPAEQLGLMLQQLSLISNIRSFVLGGRTVFSFGDLCQLRLGTPLYQKCADESDRLLAKPELCTTNKQLAQLGRQVWLMFNTCQLYEVNRFKNTPSGRM